MSEDQGIEKIATRLAPDLDRLMDQFFAGLGGVGSGSNGQALRDFLWANKIGIQRVIQSVAGGAK